MQYRSQSNVRKEADVVGWLAQAEVLANARLAYERSKALGTSFLQPDNHLLVHYVRISGRSPKMVYYFKSNVEDPPAFIYVGKDKVESKMATQRSHKIRLEG